MKAGERWGRSWDKGGIRTGGIKVRQRWDKGDVKDGIKVM